MPRFLVSASSGESFEWEFDEQTATLGRSAEAGLTLPDRFLSREHARLTRDENGLTVEDLGSRNGTFVNEVRIEEATVIRPGDAIRLSNCVLTLASTPPDLAAPSAPPASAPAPLEASLLMPAAEFSAAGADVEHTVLAGVELEHHLDRLQLLDDVHRSLAATISLSELLELILDRVFVHLGPEQGAVILARDDGEYHRVAERRQEGLTDDYFYSRTLIEEVCEKRQGALVLDAQSDDRFAGSESILESGVRSIVAAPLTLDDRSLGLIAMSSRLTVRQFERHDLELLGSLASVAALRINNVALAIEAAEREKIAVEVELARSIQEALLPQALPSLPGFELHAFNRPSRGVSGDLYQVLATETPGELFFWLCDVSGKGLAAAILTATLEALAASPIARGMTPDAICARLNDQLEERTLPDRFATAFLGRLTPDSRLAYASAGHNPALLVRDSGEVELLKRTGLPLGAMPGSSYQPEQVELGPGDLLVLYSDGLTEAMSASGAEFRLERLERAVLGARSGSLDELAGEIERRIADFTGGRPPDDDQTLVLLRRRAV